MLVVALAMHADSGELLYVFFPSTVRPHVLQKRISEVNPKIEVVVFGRFADFEEKQALTPPLAILSLPEVISAVGGYSIKFRGKRNGAESEPYFLLSIGTGMDLSKIGGTTIGAVDFLGRKRMKTLVSGMFNPAPSIKTVTKIEDLLPLITFEMAKAILVTESQVDYIRNISQLDFVKTPVPQIRSGTIGLAVKEGGAAPEITRALKSMDEDLLKLFGGVRWN